MCGRYTLSQIDGIQKAFNTDNTLPSSVRPNHNTAITQIMPVVVGKNGQPHFELMKWGIIPVWAAAKPQFAFSTFNARSDKLLESPMWKKLVTSKRCIVPATGFYEWKKDGTKKQPYYIHLKDRTFFGMAGLYDSWTDKTTGEVIATYSIITTEPNKAMRQVHDRMPVILDQDEEAHWLNPDLGIEDLLPLLDPYHEKGLELYEVDAAVGKVSNQYIELTYPLNSK